MAKESKRDQLLDHEYDGIQEYDNKLPNWWLYILYGSIAFSLLYWLFFHTFGIGKLSVERYDTEMIAAAEAQLARMSTEELTDESLLLMASIPDRLTEGVKIFEQFCVVCHGANGEGSVGPNLTDAYWLHGSRPTDIHKTVMDGVPDKGMVAWSGQLGPRRVQAVVAHLLTLKGTDVPGKAPEGELETDEKGASSEDI